MRLIFLGFILLLQVSSCESRNVNKLSIKVDKGYTHDSLEIIRSKEYQTLIKFLNWYKQGHNKLRLSVVEKEFTDKNGYYCIVDTNEAHILLQRYREGNFLAEEYINRDSIYMWKAQALYESRNLEIYDAFDHDFVLHTQETSSALKAIPKAKVVVEKTDLKKGIIALQIDGCPLLFFHVKTNSREIRITNIRN